MSHAIPAKILLAGLVVAGLPGHVRAESAMGPAGTRAAVDFRITIPAMVRIRTLVQPERIVIEQRHVAQGYVDLDAASLVQLTSNSREGYDLTVRYDVALFSHIEVRVAQQHMFAKAGCGSMRVRSARMADERVAVGYRLHLNTQVQPGSYRWPVALTFSPSAI